MIDKFAKANINNAAGFSMENPAALLIFTLKNLFINIKPSLPDLFI